MNLLLIGSGGREHALAWKLAQSPLLGTLFCAPGNPGMADVATNAVIDINNHQAVIDFCRLQNVELVVVGPEAPLVDGLADSLQHAGIATFGPSAKAAQLEGSKGFTKDLCAVDSANLCQHLFVLVRKRVEFGRVHHHRERRGIKAARNFEVMVNQFTQTETCD